MSASKTEIGRRSVLGGLAASAKLLGAPAARAQAGGELIVANWGGAYGGFAENSFEKPILEKAGIRVVHDYQDAPERMTKVVAESRLPRGRIGVVHTADFMTAQLREQNTLADVTAAEVPNLKDVLPSLISPGFVPWLYTPLMILYNPKFVSDPPKTFADLWNSKWEGKIGLMDHIFHHHLQMAGLVAGSSMTDEAKAKPALLELKKAVKPRLYPGQDTMATALKNEEVWITTGYKGRALLWADAGASLAYIYPGEGAIASSLGASLTRRAPNREAAIAYLNAMTDPEGQAKMAQASFYSPSNSKTPLPPALKARIALSEDEEKRLQVPDPTFMGKNYAAWTQWWSREYKG
ncbi:MAG: extracellular solute-binding protein [Beijerinckiaceae bacterium]|jgi:putative spermidine/putrescine transport system substrate-binding protein|nr:extracellular solute-binding protein [Beijerinckiaceae bacterium]